MNNMEKYEKTYADLHYKSFTERAIIFLEDNYREIFIYAAYSVVFIGILFSCYVLLGLGECYTLKICGK